MIPTGNSKSHVMRFRVQYIAADMSCDAEYRKEDTSRNQIKTLNPKQVLNPNPKPFKP